DRGLEVLRDRLRQGGLDPPANRVVFTSADSHEQFRDLGSKTVDLLREDLLVQATSPELAEESATVRGCVGLGTECEQTPGVVPLGVSPAKLIRVVERVKSKQVLVMIHVDTQNDGPDEHLIGDQPD